MTYADWFESHALFFGFASESERAMLASWCEHFHGPCSFTAEEVAGAGEALKRDPPKFRADHFKALKDLVWSARERAASRREREPEENDRGRCVNCNNAGQVVVPHLQTHRGKTGGRWYTMSVLCTCFAGRALGAKSQDGWLRLDQYQEEVPYWRDLMRQHDAEVRQQLQAAAEGDQLTKQAHLIDAVLGTLKTGRGHARSV